MKKRLFVIVLLITLAIECFTPALADAISPADVADEYKQLLIGTWVYFGDNGDGKLRYGDITDGFTYEDDTESLYIVADSSGKAFLMIGDTLWGISSKGAMCFSADGKYLLLDFDTRYIIYERK